jgi:hypothetical protein
MSLKTGRKNLRVYRGLYWANQGLIYAVNALGELCQESGIPHKRLRQARTMMEEARAMINDELAEWLERRDK